MKSIKVSSKNEAAIVAALAAVNGSATQHTFVNAWEIATVVRDLELAVVNFVGSKDAAVGAVAFVGSGKAVAKAYKYPRKTTRIKLHRRSSGWFLVDVQSDVEYARAGTTVLKLTLEQDAKAVANLRSQYRVQSPTMPQSVQVQSADATVEQNNVHITA